MSFLDHIHACNAWDPTGFVPWFLDGERMGRLDLGFADELRRWPGQFRVAPDAVHWTPTASDFDGRAQALAEINAVLVAAGVIDHLHGESFPVTAGGRHQARLLIDRACAPYFGVRAFGQQQQAKRRAKRRAEYHPVFFGQQRSIFYRLTDAWTGLIDINKHGIVLTTLSRSVLLFNRVSTVEQGGTTSVDKNNNKPRERKCAWDFVD